MKQEVQSERQMKDLRVKDVVVDSGRNATTTKRQKTKGLLPPEELDQQFGVPEIFARRFSTSGRKK
jgi:hypothetical protein